MKAVRKAISLAKFSGAELVALYVADFRLLTNFPDTGEEMVIAEFLEKEGEKALDRVQELAKDQDLPFTRLLKEGHPSTVILEVAEELECDLIVMGTHGRTGLDHLLMGSVAESVTRHAKCSVFVVSGKDK
jgi:nucleotide-binding universal stress UspA family protein